MKFLLESMRCHSFPKKVRQLLDLPAQKSDYLTEEGCIADLNLTHEAIAETAGTTRVTVLHLLQEPEAAQQLAKIFCRRVLPLSGWQHKEHVLLESFACP